MHADGWSGCDDRVLFMTWMSGWFLVLKNKHQSHSLVWLWCSPDFLTTGRGSLSQLSSGEGRLHPGQVPSFIAEPRRKTNNIHNLDVNSPHMHSHSAQWHSVDILQWQMLRLLVECTLTWRPFAPGALSPNSNLPEGHDSTDNRETEQKIGLRELSPA